MIALFSRNLSSFSRKQTHKSNIAEQCQNICCKNKIAWRMTWATFIDVIAFYIGVSFLRCKHKVLQKYFVKPPFDGKKLTCIDIAPLVFFLWHFIAWHLMGQGERETGRKGGREKRRREAGEKGENYPTLQLTKMQPGGSQQIQGGSRD